MLCYVGAKVILIISHIAAKQQSLVSFSEEKRRGGIEGE